MLNTASPIASKGLMAKWRRIREKKARHYSWSPLFLSKVIDALNLYGRRLIENYVNKMLPTGNWKDPETFRIPSKVFRGLSNFL